MPKRGAVNVRIGHTHVKGSILRPQAHIQIGTVARDMLTIWHYGVSQSFEQESVQIPYLRLTLASKVINFLAT